MSFSAPTVQPVALPQPSPTVMNPSVPQGQKPGAKSSQPSYIGAAVSPEAGQVGQKTLLGQ